MTSRDFCYWLQGHFELNPGAILSLEQVKAIRNHLNMVFIHEIDPSNDGGDLVKKMILQTVHDGAPTDPYNQRLAITGRHEVASLLDLQRYPPIAISC